MKKLISVFMLISTILFSAPERGNFDSYVDYKKSEMEINLVYQEIFEMYKGEDKFLSTLKEAQKSWMKYRDSQLEINFSSVDLKKNSEANQPSEYYEEMQKMTEARIVLLREWITGTTTGDLCKGSIRFNNYPEENITTDRPLKKVLEKLEKENRELRKEWDEKIKNKESCNIMFSNKGDELDWKGEAILEQRKSELELETVIEALNNKNYADDSFKDKLKNSQEAWNKYIELHFESKYPEDRSQYGTVLTICYYNLTTYYTNLRIKELRETLVNKNEDKLKKQIAELEEEQNQLVETLSDLGVWKEQCEGILNSNKNSGN